MLQQGCVRGTFNQRKCKSTCSRTSAPQRARTPCTSCRFDTFHESTLPPATIPTQTVVRYSAGVKERRHATFLSNSSSLEASETCPSTCFSSSAAAASSSLVPLSVTHVPELDVDLSSSPSPRPSESSLSSSSSENSDDAYVDNEGRELRSQVLVAPGHKRRR
jgi:hypothetical protein